ncbi:M48 family metalloprotease [Dactylosporangium sp. NPDC048998]|uniref:M48 family metalloprotease n=1 Tax=Dactylosporangium sp. NPDC048998 TaxID=3363976 RepID=UPI00371B412A
MTWPVYLPLLLPALLLPAGRLAAAARRPERAARALAAAALLSAGSAAGCVALLAATLVDDLPSLERQEQRAFALGHALPEPVPDWAGAAAALALAWLLYRVAAETRRRRRVAADLHAAGRPHDGLLVAGWAAPHAIAVPPTRRRPGHVLVTSGLLRMLGPAERDAVLAHERAHLALRHHRTAAMAGLAAAADPLLRPVSVAVGLLLERSADETAAAAVGSPSLVARTIARVALAAHEDPGPGHDNPGNLLAATGSDVVRRVEALTRPGALGRVHATRATVALAGAAGLALASLTAAGAALAGFLDVVRAWLPVL